MIGSQRISPSLSENICSQQVLLCKQCGFTLIEMLIVVAILGILATVSSGAFDSAPRDSDLRKDALDGLHGALASARFAALSSGRTVRVTVYGAAAPAAVQNSFGATHLGGTWDGVNDVAVGGGKFFPKVQILSANPGCTVLNAMVSKTFVFSANATVGVLPALGTFSVGIRSTNPAVVGNACVQVRSITGRVGVVRP